MVLKKIIKLSENQNKHFNSCAYIDSCDFCHYIVKKLNKGYEIEVLKENDNNI